MRQKMRALIKQKPGQGLSRGEVDRPNCGPNDVIIKIEKTAICGTDVHIYKWDEWASRNVPTPLVIGHEYYGVIDEVGELVSGYEKGDRVSGEGHITCGSCRNCRAGRRHLCRNTQGIGVNVAGAFADYLVLPAFNAFKIPANIPDEFASIFDPLGNAVHTALSFDLTGEDVLITGAGPIGIMACAVARHVGARHVVVTDVNDYRLNLAKQSGATRTVDASQENLKDIMKELGMKEGFDVGLEMSGNVQAFTSMLSTMNHGGRIALLGILPENVSINWNDVIFKGLQIKGIYGREMFETWYKMASLLQGGLDISKVITHRIQMDDYEEGFAAMCAGRAAKVIMNWT